MTKTLHVTLSVSTENEAAAVEIAEAMGRQAIGFALNGQRTMVTIDQWDSETEDEEAL